MGDHRNLKVWQEACALAGRIYLVTREFPPEEKFGLIMQCRLGAASIMANLAEAADVGMADGARLEAIQGELSKIRARLARLAKRLSDGLSDSG